MNQLWQRCLLGGLILLLGIGATLAYADGPEMLPGFSPSAAPPALGGCQIFPTNNIWNTPIDTLPVDPNSDAYIANIGAGTSPHADFGAGVWPPGSNSPIGIPYVVVPANQPLVDITSFLYDDQSDPGPYPVPSDPPIEGGADGDGDRHVLILRQGECRLYELYNTFPNGDGTWYADSGAIFDLNSNALRPDTWTSADAAGLPILPGLVRYEEVLAGEINHAIRFTVDLTRDEHLWPARHDASDSSDPNRPPLGQYFRLKADVVIDNSFSPQGRVILRAMQKYGLILADNGSDWYISGTPNESWNNDDLADDFGRITGADFEAVDVSSLIVDPDSGQVVSQDDFALSLAPANRVIDPGDTTTYQLNLTVSGNFTAPVTLVAGNPSPDLLVDLTPSVLPSTGQATLTVTDTHIGPLPLGLFYRIPITGTGGDLTHLAEAGLLVGGQHVYLPVIRK